MKCKTCESEQDFGAYCLNCGTPFDTPEARKLQEKYKPTKRQRIKVRWGGWYRKNKINEKYANWYLTLRALIFIGSNLILNIIKWITIGITFPIWVWWFVWKGIYSELRSITESNVYIEIIPERWQVRRDRFYSFLLTILILSLLISIFGQFHLNLFGIPLFAYLGFTPVVYFIFIMTKVYESLGNIPNRFQVLRDRLKTFLSIILLLSVLISISQGQIDYYIFGIPLFGYVGLLPLIYFTHIMTEFMLIVVYRLVKIVGKHIRQVKVQLDTKDTEKKGNQGKGRINEM